MGAPEFTVDGITIQTFDEIFDELVNGDGEHLGYKDIYGNDINVDQDSPDGQRIGIEAKARLDIQTFLLSFYNQFDPDFSSGTFQDILFKLIGIQALPATRSSANVTVTTDRNLTLPLGYKIKDDLDQEWETEAEENLITGANIVAFVSSEYGAIAADAGTITSLVSVVLGVLSVTNPAVAVAGRDEETEEEKRIRRNKSLENAAYSTTGGMFAKLSNVNGVTDLIIYENDTNVTDSVRNILPHTLWIVIAGGFEADIAEVIVKNKTGGTGLKGSAETTYAEDVYKPDGSAFTFTHNVKYDRPTEVDLYVNVTATRKVTGQALDLALIKSEIAERLFTIAESCSASELYYYGYQAGSNFVLTDLEISDDDITYTADAISPDYDEKFIIDVANITVTEVP